MVYDFLFTIFPSNFFFCFFFFSIFSVWTCRFRSMRVCFTIFFLLLVLLSAGFFSTMCLQSVFLALFSFLLARCTCMSCCRFIEIQQVFFSYVYLSSHFVLIFIFVLLFFIARYILCAYTQFTTQ